MFRQNVFARAEYAHLNKLNKKRQGLFLVCINLVLVANTFLAVEHYADVVFHTVIGLGLVMLCWGCAIYSVMLAVESMNHEKHQQTWEPLILTGVFGRRIVVGKWLAVMRYLLGTVLLLTISKLAIAYSVMQYLNIYPDWIDEAIQNWNRPFIYMSFTDYSAPIPIAYYPHIWQVIFAFIVLLMLSLAEIGLLSALGLLASFIHAHWGAIKVVWGGCLRVGLCAVGLGLTVAIGNIHIAHPYLNYPTGATYWGCDGDYLRKQSDYYAWCVVERNNRRILETVQVATSALFDNGVLLAANIMRPIGSIQFALRNSFSAVIAFIVICSLSALSLFGAAHFAQRQR